MRRTLYTIRIVGYFKKGEIDFYRTEIKHGNGSTSSPAFSMIELLNNIKETITIKRVKKLE